MDSGWFLLCSSTSKCESHVGQDGVEVLSVDTLLKIRCLAKGSRRNLERGNEEGWWAFVASGIKEKFCEKMQVSETIS